MGKITVALLLSLVFSVAASAFDPVSNECLSCHRDVTPKRICPLKDCDHPIGIDYAERAAVNPALVPVLRLNPAVRLVDNTIGCTTCHVPYSKENHLELTRRRAERMETTPPGPDPMLVMNNRGSALCLACHRK